jgi:tetratricopeptide (TPR) repeat protein
MKDLLDAPPTKPKRGMPQVHKGFLLWVLLITLFIAIYQLFSTTPSPRGNSDGAGHWWLMWIAVVAAIGWIFWVRRQTVRFNRENAEGIALLHKGVPEKAAEIFERLIRRHRHMRNLSAVAQYNAGVARLREGKPERAIEFLMLVANDKRVGQTMASASAELTSAYAIAGRLDEASESLAKAEQRGNVNAFTLAWPRTLLAARRGEHAELARGLEQRWRELESVLSGDVMRRLLLIRAFAVASVDGPRSAGAAQPLVDRLRPSVPGEYDWLSARWPELGAFLEAHQL